MFFPLFLLLVTLSLPLAIKFGLIKGKIRKQLEEDNKKVKPLLIFSLLYMLPLAIAIALVNYIRNGMMMPCMSSGDLVELVRLPLPDGFCLSHWWDILIIWEWGFATLIFFKFYKRLKLEIIFLIATMALGIYASYYYSGALYGLITNVVSLTCLRLVDIWMCRFFEIEECNWHFNWRRMKFNLVLIIFLNSPSARRLIGIKG